MAASNIDQLHQTIQMADDLPPEDQLTLLEHLMDRLSDSTLADVPESEDDWALEGEKLAFMQKHHDNIRAAYVSGDFTMIDSLEASEEYRNLFSDMSWDEAYDRYEETWWQGEDASDAS